LTLVQSSSRPLTIPPWYERANLDIQEFSAAGVRTFAVVEGKPDGFPVLFLHGLPGGAFIWADVIKALGRARLSIAPDLPGWGKSFTRFSKAEPDLMRDGLAAWLSGVLAAQNVQRCDLVAHGSGVWPAIELLMTDPSRVRRLALVSADLWEGGTHAGMSSRLFGTAKWTRKRIEHWLDKRAALTEHAKEVWHPQLVSLLGSGNDARTSPMLLESEFAERIALYRTALASYKGAEMFIWGMNDPQAPENRVAELVATLNSAESHRIEHTGHYPMLDAAEEVAALLKEFLGE
jgi:pimeloyl-ACP methyl ester carboxylesterase